MSALLSDRDRSTASQALRIAAEVYCRDALQARATGQTSLQAEFSAQAAAALELAERLDP